MPTVKLYVTASAEVRARRRLDEIEGNGGTADFAEILADIERRDERDMGRADSPLKPAADAHLLDTSEMDIEAAFLAAKAIIDDAMAARDKARHPADRSAPWRSACAMPICRARTPPASILSAPTRRDH